MRFPIVAAVALALAAVAFAPILENAAADHVYTHRYIIQGRVVDEEGRPVQGAVVNVELKGWFPADEGVEGPCPQEQAGQRTGERTFAAQTSPLGDYRFCIHAHQLIDAGSVVVTVGNQSAEEDKDMRSRIHLVHFTVASGVGAVGDTERFNSEAGIRGRLWRPLSSGDRIEGIPAEGVAIARAPIHVTLVKPDGTEETGNGTTNNYGEFGVQFDYEGSLEGAQYVVRASGEEWTIDADATFRVNDELLVIDRPLGGNDSPGFGLLAVLFGVTAAIGLVASRRFLGR